jgi:hypothetical protein
MNHLVELELIDLTGIELGEASAHLFEQRPQLTLVVGSDELSRGTPLGLLR